MLKERCVACHGALKQRARLRLDTAALIRKGGRHVRYAKETPLANLQLALLDKLAIPLENFGDSTGKLTV